MLKELIASPEAQTQGYVIDLDYAHQEKPYSWVKKFQEHDILSGQQLTHIVELLEDNYEIKSRAATLWQTPADNRVFGKWERDLRVNRKKPVDEDGNEVDDDDDEAAKWKHIVKLESLVRVCDNEENVQAELSQYESPERPEVEDWLVKMYQSTYIKLPSSGLTPD